MHPEHPLFLMVLELKMPISLFSRMQKAELAAQSVRHEQFISWLTNFPLVKLSGEAKRASADKPWDGCGVTLTNAARTRIQRRDGMAGIVICTDRHALITAVFHIVMQQGDVVVAVRPDNRLVVFRAMALAALGALEEPDGHLASAIFAAAACVMTRELCELRERCAISAVETSLA